MTILQQNKVGLENDVTTRNNPNSSSVIYLNASKLVQCRLVANNNMRERGEGKKNETANNTAAQKLCLQQKISEYFQKFQDSMCRVVQALDEKIYLVDITITR